jgi:phage baseplate assembly protein W
MPHNPGQINFKFPLRAHNRGFFAGNDTTLAAVREDIKILLLTRKGERVINSGIGTNIAAYGGELFRQINKAEMRLRITNEIRSVLGEWMPHVNLTKVTVITDDDDPSLKPNDILIKMDYELTRAETANDSIQLRISG